jgi:hypothetical protein
MYHEGNPLLDSLTNEDLSIKSSGQQLQIKQCPLYLLSLTFEEKTVEITLSLN